MRTPLATDRAVDVPDSLLRDEVSAREAHGKALLGETPVPSRTRDVAAPGAIGLRRRAP